MAILDHFANSSAAPSSSQTLNLTMTTDLPFHPGDFVPSHFDPGVIAASCFASLCGCLLTVELLHRRGTGLRNWRSWLWTLACATSMGLIGIWCMHFIGNRAIKLDNGQPDLQLVYSPGWTFLSVVLPVIGLFSAFSIAEFHVRSRVLHWILLGITGLLAGGSIVGMHYIGNLGITNYHLHYANGFLGVSVALAVADCIVVMVLFYTLRELWINSWWRRALCAVTLAAGVSAMHFTASTGCKYRFKHMNGGGNVSSRNAQVIIAGALCAAAALIVLGVLFFTRYRAKVLKKRAQKVMLASAVFDPDGRILVTTEGTLPAHEITDKYSYSSFSGEFDTAHQVLQWIFRVTYNWAGVSDLVPKMKDHLGSYRRDADEDSGPSSSSSSGIFDPSTYNDYSVLFRERFCVAAASLASTMHVPLEKLGVLYDKIIETGTLPDEKRGRRGCAAANNALSEDLEGGIKSQLFGKGQLLFLVRQVARAEADRLLSSGFRFATIQNVGRAIAEPMQIPLTVLESYIADLKRYVENLASDELPGTWLALFTLIPKPHSSGFDVLVNKVDQNRLPASQILHQAPEQYEADFLNHMHGWTAPACVTFLNERAEHYEELSPREQVMVPKVRKAISVLFQQVPADWFRAATFYAKPVYAQYSQLLQGRAMATVLYSFIIMGDMHTPTDAYDTIARVPLSFFKMRQRCFAGSADHAVLAREIHQEFGPLLARKTPRKETATSKVKSTFGGKNRHRPRTMSGALKHRNSANADNWSEHELVDRPNHIPELTESNNSDHSRDDVWGGILVNSETVVKTDNESDVISQNGKDLALGLGMGMRVNVGTVKQEDTFVDELFAATKKQFLPAKPGF